jgi:hypothetical protein
VDGFAVHAVMVIGAVAAPDGLLTNAAFVPNDLSIAISRLRLRS